MSGSCSGRLHCNAPHIRRQEAFHAETPQIQRIKALNANDCVIEDELKYGETALAPWFRSTRVLKQVTNAFKLRPLAKPERLAQLNGIQPYLAELPLGSN